MKSLKFDKYAIKFEERREGHGTKYKRKMRAQFWKNVYDFIRNRMKNRRLDAIIIRKFGDNGISNRYYAFNKRIVLATINRVMKSRAFTQNAGEVRSLIFLSALSKIGVEG